MVMRIEGRSSRKISHTCIDFSTYAEYGLAYPRAYDRTVLSLVAHNLLATVLDVFSVGLGPRRRQRTECFKLIACECSETIEGIPNGE